MYRSIKNKVFILFLVIIFNIVFVFASENVQTSNMGIIINDVKLTNDYSIISKEDKIYIPISALQNNLGIKVSLENENIMWLSWLQNYLSIDLEKNITIINNKKAEDTFDVFLQNGNTYYGADTVNKIFGYTVEKVPELNSLRIIYNQTILSKEELIKKYIKPAVKPNKVAYLTFDDGLDRTVTPKVLDVLKENDIKATFFVIGNTIKGNTDILKRIKDEGHAIGNHTYSHIKSIVYSSVSSFKKELDETAFNISDVTGEEPTIFRPPYGSTIIKSSSYQDALKDYKVVLWNIDSMDSRIKNISSQQIANNVIDSLKNKKSAIILFHLGKSKENTLKALPQVIKYLKDNNFFINSIDKSTELKYEYN